MATDIMKELRDLKDSCGTNKKYCWIEKSDLIKALENNLVQLEVSNSDQGDETFKTIVIFENRKFVYVGDKIEV